MTTKAQVLGDVCELFFELTGILFIQINPQATGAPGTPRPTGLHGSVGLTTTRDTGSTDRVEYANAPGAHLPLDETVSGMKEVVLSIIAYRQGAGDFLAALRHRLQSNRVREILNQRGLGYAGRSEIRDITIPSSGGLEERHQFDLRLFVVASFTEEVDSIHSVHILGKDRDDSIIANINISNEE